VWAAAIVAQYDPDWASDESWGGMVNMIIRDVAAWDRDDPLFPFLRSYDIYAGHSWAAGHASFAEGNNQESSSESLNFSAATALWGSITGNQIIRDTGIFLFTNELNAVEQYWFDIDHEVFPTSFQHVCVGMVWGTKGAHATWFSAEPEMIHGINFLPVTSASLYLGRDPDYVLENYNEIVSENGGAENEWVDIIWEFLALADPALAISKFNNYPNYPVEEGETRAHTYYWLHNLNSMGQVDLPVTANIPNYAVFLADSIRTYIAYNPGFNDITAEFSDGELLVVPAREIVSLKRNINIVSADEDQITQTSPTANLYAAFPNPFNPSATISFFTTENRENTEIAVYNLKGQKVKTLVDDKLVSGHHSVVWNGNNEAGKPVSSGIYLYKLRSGNFQQTRKIVLIK